MANVYVIIKTNDDKTFLLDSIKTSQNKAIIRVDVLHQQGYKAKFISALVNETDIDEIVNTTHCMSFISKYFNK